ncbi:hypothetical protein SM124_18765 [Bacillus sp. 31A1R]|uniref:Imidazoleglycerol-phosphate dehydratase n=1 Tax=Robertmurraya mangrovi TaxID=3098077 RepID=A0ABU5J2Z5_9BACI|nr:hypothetical protein [Bacillus sp. 31A1R]MDZ5473764.1 hypothetical protein [Bacillus sp. 31A1R]
MSKQGRKNNNQNEQQYGKQRGKSDVEFGNEFQVGNDSSQSQKKSGRQINKK